MSIAVKWLLAVFFGAIILFGESFKITDVNVAGVILGVMCANLLLLFIRRPNLRMRRDDVALLAIALVFAGLGFMRYRTSDVMEDLIPFVVFLAVAVSFPNLPLRDRMTVYRLIVVFSAVALLKVLAIAFLPIEPEWGGNTFWQASKVPMSSGLNRVILKGGDIFIGVSATVVAFHLMLKRRLQRLFHPKVAILLLITLVAGVVQSFTRASLGALFLALSACFLLLRRSGVMQHRRVLVAVATAALVAVLALQSGALWYQSFSERVLDPADMALVYRQVEALNALDAARQASFLGAGLGAYFYTPLSGSAKVDGRSLYAHFVPVWLVLKVGALGALVFYFVIGRSIVRARRAIGEALADNRIESVMLLATNLAGLVFLVAVDSLNNKFATLSGAAAYAALMTIPGGLREG